MLIERGKGREQAESRAEKYPDHLEDSAFEKLGLACGAEFRKPRPAHLAKRGNESAQHSHQALSDREGNNRRRVCDQTYNYIIGSQVHLSADAGEEHRPAERAQFLAIDID